MENVGKAAAVMRRENPELFQKMMGHMIDGEGNLTGIAVRLATWGVLERWICMPLSKWLQHRYVVSSLFGATHLYHLENGLKASG